MMGAQKIVGALKDDPDWGKIIDESFLPDDLRRKPTSRCRVSVTPGRVASRLRLRWCCCWKRSAASV